MRFSYEDYLKRIIRDKAIVKNCSDDSIAIVIEGKENRIWTEPIISSGTNWKIGTGGPLCVIGT